MSWTERRPGERGGPMVEKHGEEKMGEEVMVRDQSRGDRKSVV